MKNILAILLTSTSTSYKGQILSQKIPMLPKNTEWLKKCLKGKEAIRSGAIELKR